MTEAQKKSTFTLIKSPKRREVTEQIFPMPTQAELFSSYAPNVLVFISFPSATEEEFIRALDHAKPALIIDLRRFPRFDIGSLTRQRAFEEFGHRQISYVDYAWSPSEVDRLDHSFPYLASETRRLRGRVMIILEERPNTSELLDAVRQQIHVLTRADWDVVRIPSYAPNPATSTSAAS